MGYNGLRVAVPRLPVKVTREPKRHEGNEMSSSHDQSYITRRDLLKKAGLAAGVWAGSALACGQGEELVHLTPTSPATPPTIGPEPTSAPTAAPVTPVAPTMAPATPVAPPEQAAYTVLLNGKVITVDPTDTIAQAVAVKDGLIQAVGSDELGTPDRGLPCHRRPERATTIRCNV
jgi:hypothetical protein